MEENKTITPDVKHESNVADVEKNTVSETDTLKTENLIPQSRFNVVNDERKELLQWKDARVKTEERAKLEEMEKAGRYEEILGKKDSEIERLTKIEERFLTWESEERNRQLSLIPEQEREKFQHLSVEDLKSINQTFTPEDNRAPIDTVRASARMNVIKPFSAKHNAKDEQKKGWADKLKSYR